MTDSPKSEAVLAAGVGAPTRIRRRVVLWSQLIGPVGYWKIGIIAALLIIIYREELQRLFYIWTHNGDWSHGLLVPVYSLYFLHTRRQYLLGRKEGGSYLGLLVMGLAGLLFLISVAGPRIGYARSVSLVVAIYGAAWLVGGGRVARVAWFPAFFLMFAVPIPAQIMFQLTLPMRQIASQVAAAVVSLIPGAWADAEGTVIVASYMGEVYRLNVERACAGMRLMMAFFALGTAIAFLSERPVWHQVVMLASCVPIALFCNILRVTTTSLIHVFVGKEYASGSAHTILGLSMLLVAFGLFFAISYVLNNLFLEVPEEDERAEGSAGPAV
jgi:exosortase